MKTKFQYFISNMTLLRFCSILSGLCVIVLLWFTLQPVVTSWGECDILLLYIIAGIAVTSIVCTILIRRSIHCSPIDIAIFLWYLYTILYAYLQTTYPVASICLRLTQLFILYFFLRFLFQMVQIKSEIIAIFIVISALIESVWGLHQMFTDTSRHYIYPLTGSFQNPGPYSIYLAIGIVLQAKLYHQSMIYLKNIKYGNIIELGYILLISFLTCMMLLTCGRTAFLSIAILLICMYWRYVKKYKRWIILAFVVVCVVLYFIKQCSANGRGIMAWISLKIISDNFFIGTGIGSFFHQYAEQVASISRNLDEGSLLCTDVINYTFNLPLRIGVEQGLLGLLLGLFLIILIVRALHKQDCVLKWGLFVLLLSSLTSYTFELQPFQVIFVLIVAHIASSKYAFNTKITFTKKSSSFIPCISFFAIVFLMWLWITPHIKVRVQATQESKPFMGLMHQAFINDYYELLPYMLDNPRFLFCFAKTLRNAERYNDSNAVLRDGILVSTDPMFYVVMGNNYRTMEAYREAEECYTKAYNMLPNRMYPLYQLLNMYIELSDVTNARDMAQRLVDFEPKVRSSATDDMKKFATEYLKHHIK